MLDWGLNMCVFGLYCQATLRRDWRFCRPSHGVGQPQSQTRRQVCAMPHIASHAVAKY